MICQCVRLMWIQLSPLHKSAGTWTCLSLLHEHISECNTQTCCLSVQPWCCSLCSALLKEKLHTLCVYFMNPCCLSDHFPGLLDTSRQVQKRGKLTNMAVSCTYAPELRCTVHTVTRGETKFDICTCGNETLCSSTEKITVSPRPDSFDLVTLFR